MANTPENWGKLKETRKRLEKCWMHQDVDWELYPAYLKQGCQQIGEALNLPSTAILSGYLVLGSFIMSPATIKVPGTDWEEPILLWLTITMPTGSGKSTLFRHLYKVLKDVRRICEVGDDDPSWVVDDASFEKMGLLMSENSSRLLGFYDELSAFLSQINLYKGRGLSDSHELSVFLQLYNGHPWRRDTVSGEANFVMGETRLSVGGFTQPGVARNLIEMPSIAEKGLSHRFLWVFPKPLYGSFKSLKAVNSDFIDALSNLFASQWRKKARSVTTISSRMFELPKDSAPFMTYYDEIQGYLKSAAGMDELLAGMLSKSRGQVLRLAAVFHLLFSLTDQELSESLPVQVSEDAVKAAIDFVKISSQQVAFIAGRGDLKEEIMKLEANDDNDEITTPDENATAAMTILLPGKVLYLTPLLNAKKYRKKGNKEGAIRAFMQLEEEGLGEVVEVGGGRGTSTHYEFHKVNIPESSPERAKFMKKLQKYNISLSQYSNSIKQSELKRAPKRVLSFDHSEGRKTPRTSPSKKTPKKSPHKTPSKSPHKSSPKKSSS